MQIEVSNFKMAYDDRGEGIPLLFIHGYPLSRQMWRPQIEGLSHVARLLAPDLRGHGQSDEMPGPYSMDTLADDLDSFLDGMEISQPVVVCGLSMGGYVAMAFYRKYGVRVGGMILAATRAGADSPDARQKRDEAMQTAREKGVGAIVESMLPKMMAPQAYRNNPGLVEYVRSMMLDTSLQGVLGDLQGMKERPDSLHTLNQIELPVLILHGQDDQIIPVSEAEAMRDEIRNANLELIPDAGHLLNLEQPERFNDAVRRYLETLQSTGRQGL